jgi:hypothetical protein
MRATTPPWQIWPLVLIAIGAGASRAALSSPLDYGPPNSEGLCSGSPTTKTSAPTTCGAATARTLSPLRAAPAGSIAPMLRAHPDWSTALQSSVWWGCGSPDLGEIRSLRQRIDTHAAHASLAEEPYRNLGAPGTPAAPRPSQ